MFNNIPAEIRAWAQWLVWKEETTQTGRVTKIPYNAVTGRVADITDPKSWTTFDQAVSISKQYPEYGLGFALSVYDPYSFIDADDPYAKNADGTFKHKDPEACAQLANQVISTFNSYSEISPSGRGLHIIVKGKVPKGRRRWGVEVYSDNRFMTMTGNVYNPAPITEQQTALDSLYQHLGGAPEVYAHNATFEDKYPDADILQRMFAAENGTKAWDLYHGNFQQYYPSQSEADFALINILAFYTTSFFQIERLFKQSALGQREKAERGGYVQGMITRAFDRMPPPIDIDGIRTALEARMTNPPATEVTEGPGGINEETQAETIKPAPTTLAEPAAQSNPYLAPVPGAVGEVARFIYAQAPRPVAELALAASLAMFAGIAGRAYNVSNTGLNQYILALAPTGRGKEAITSGVTTLFQYMTGVGAGLGNCPGAKEFLGPERIASGQALIKYLDHTSRSFLTLQGEFDNTLKQMTSKHANAALIVLKQNMLAFYSRSGRGQVVQPMIYSDKANNTTPVEAPAFSILGEGTPERFYELLDEGLVADGLLPRFTIIEYNGPRPAHNDKHAQAVPSPELVTYLAQLASYCMMLNQSNTVVDVGYSGDGKIAMDMFNIEVDDHINSAQNETVAELWNRAHLKALKIAAVIAVGCNTETPVIDGYIANWAISVVKYDTQRLVDKFAAGDVGEGDNKQMADMKRKIRDYVEGRVTLAVADKSYHIGREAFEARLVNYTYLYRTCCNLVSFKGDRMGASNAIKKTINDLVSIGVLQELGHADIEKINGGRVRWFWVKDYENL